jgi:hypothetical protein
MTLLNMTPEYGELKASAFTAESLPGPRIMDGYTHMLLKHRGDVIELYRRVVERGLMQHWGTVHGDICRELQFLYKLYGLNLHML